MHPVPSPVNARPDGALVTVVVTAPPLCVSSAPTLTNACGAFWFAYSVPIHPAPRATAENLASSIFPLNGVAVLPPALPIANGCVVAFTAELTDTTDPLLYQPLAGLIVPPANGLAAVVR